MPEPEMTREDAERICKAHGWKTSLPISHGYLEGLLYGGTGQPAPSWCGSTPWSLRLRPGTCYLSVAATSATGSVLVLNLQDGTLSSLQNAMRSLATNPPTTTRWWRTPAADPSSEGA
jgi:hypothetical protein